MLSIYVCRHVALLIGVLALLPWCSRLETKQRREGTRHLGYPVDFLIVSALQPLLASQVVFSTT